MEPYPTPNLIQQDLLQILEAISFVDKIIFGRTNYCKDVTKYKDNKEFYNKSANKVIEFCENHNIEYYIKEKTISKLK